MSDIKTTVKENLIRLRHANGLTQIELAGKINYSDKAISRWETGEVTPDIETLDALAALYGVPVTHFFLTPEEAQKKTEKPVTRASRRVSLLVLAISLVWAVALSLFFLFLPLMHNAFCILLWGVPATMLLLAIYFHMGRHTVTRTVFLSLFVWTALITAYLQTAIPALFPILFLGIPLEALVIIFPYLKRKKI